jgi:peroxiredoxin
LAHPARNLPLAFSALPGIFAPLVAMPGFKAGEERMSIHAWMLAGLLIGAPPSPPGDAVPVPKLDKGLEITWRGTFSEAILRPNVRAFRSYEVETRLFVWDASPKGADAALLTSIKLKPDIKPAVPPSAIVRLELVRIDPHGKISMLNADAFTEAPDKRKSSGLPLLFMEGLPTFEPNLFVEFPTSTMKIHQAWDVAEDKRPNHTFRIDGFESVKGARSCRVIATQQTEDWENPHIDQTAWRRVDTISISCKYGYCGRLERSIEKRDPQSGQVGFRSKLACEQVGIMRYPDRFGDDRREEIMAAAQFATFFEQSIREPSRDGTKPFEQLLARIDIHLTSHVPGDAIPYREAILSVKRKAEAAKRGYIPPVPPPPETIGDAASLALSKAAPDITLTNLINNESTRLSKLRGRPVVLLYYQPSSARTAEPVLRFAQTLYERHGAKAFILPLAIGPNDAALKQRNDLTLTVNVVAGREVYKIHGVASAPCFAVLDDTGVVRKMTLGWSDENAGAIRDELEKWLK